MHKTARRVAQAIGIITALVALVLSTTGFLAGPVAGRHPRVRR